MASVVNPAIPYIGGIPGGMKDGTHIIVNGQAAPHQTIFAINLACGTNLNPRSDTALHFKVMFYEKHITRNCLQSGKWGREENHGGMPLQRGIPFEIEIIAQHKHFSMKVNGKHFTDFNHRIPKHKVNTLTIEGDVFINSIRFQEGQQHGGGAQPRHPPSGAAYPPPGGSRPEQPVYNPSVPFNKPISGGLYPGRTIYISGVPHPNAQRFTVNLQCGAYDQSDIGLHFDARINIDGNFNTVVRNHREGGQWGSEERQLGYFPFFPRANFDMMIKVEDSCFKVAVNNQHILEFFHRIQPLSRVDHLKITGDLKLTQVQLQ